MVEKVIVMANEEDEETIVRSREKKEPEVEGEKIDAELEQDAPGADIDKIANLLWDFSKELVFLEAAVEAWDEEEDEDARKDILEELPDMISIVGARMKRLVDYRVKFGKGVPPADEYELLLRDRAKIYISKAKEILKEAS